LRAACGEAIYPELFFRGGRDCFGLRPRNDGNQRLAMAGTEIASGFALAMTGTEIASGFALAMTGT